MRRHLLWALALLLACACHRGPRSGPFRLAFFPNLTHAQALVGNAEGTFHQALGGQPLEMTQFTAGPSAIEALISGSVDVCYVGSGPAINAYTRARGALHIIAGSASGGAVLVVQPSISRPEDLLGRRVASPQLGNSQDIALRTWLKGRGFPISDVPGRKDAVTVTPLSNADILGLFKRGDLAGAWVPEPWGARLVAEAHGHLLLDERTLWAGGQFPTTVLVASEAALTHRREQVKAILRAHLALTRRAQEDPAAFGRAANQAYGALTRHPLSEAELKEALSRLRFQADLLPAQLALAAAHAKALGFIPTEDISGLVDSSLLQEVIGTPPP